MATVCFNCTGWNQGFFDAPTVMGGNGGVFLHIPEPSQPWERKERRCPPAWPNMCSSYSSTMKQIASLCLGREMSLQSHCNNISLLGNSTGPDSALTSYMERQQAWSSNLCSLFCRCYELYETFFLLHVCTAHSRGQTLRPGEIINTSRFLMEDRCLMGS